MRDHGAEAFVLVHSAWLGGWAWDRVAWGLEDEGHKVFTPDLPGHGQDRTPPAAVTMKGYVRPSPTSSTRCPRRRYWSGTVWTES